MTNILSQAQQAAAHGVMLSREKDAYLYQCASDRGDFETMHQILTRAESDPELAAIIDEIDSDEMEEAAIDVPPAALQKTWEMVQGLIEKHRQKGEMYD